MKLAKTVNDMNKIEKIRAEIERLYDGEAPKHDQQCDFDDGYFTGISTISNFLDTLSEEPDKSLDEAADEYAYNVYPSEGVANIEICEAFKAGAEWQKSQMMKEAVEGYVNYYEDSGGKLMAEAQVGCPYHIGDKVKLIVIKKKENK